MRGPALLLALAAACADDPSESARAPEPGAREKVLRAEELLPRIEEREAFEELVALRAELGARADRDALDERTGRELALRLHERKLRRDLQGADLVRATELQARLAKIRTALGELA